MPSPMLIVRSTVILSTTAIAALSITTFYKLGYAYHYFPYLPSGGEQMYGPINPDTEHWDSYLKPMTLIYDGSTEVCAWVATGISIVAAVIIVIIEAVRVCRSQGGGKSNKQGLSKAMGITAVAWAATAFVVSCIVAIYANAHYHKLKKTCNFVDEPGRRYTCTWELSTCELEPKWAWYSRVDYGRGFVCEETRFVRHALIPLAILSGLVAFGYGAQMWLAKGGQKGGVSVEERVKWLREEEDE